MGNEWDISIWTCDQKWTGRTDAEYEWVQMASGEGLEYLITALATVRLERRPVQVVYRGWMENEGEMVRD